MSEKTKSERILQTKRDILAIKTLLESLVAQKAEQMEHASPLPSVSHPPSETTKHLHHYPERQHKGFSEPTSGTRHLKPASLNNFSGDRMKGQAFLNSCELYMNLVPHQFRDDHVRIMWAFSFMKSDHAARFVDRHMRNYQAVRSPPYNMWHEFVQEFISEFCPKNKIQTAQTDLKTLRYFQGSKTVDEYVDEFREMIMRARYLEGSHIVLKFQQGLNLKIQDYVACLTEGRPSDENPHKWYAAAILCDENRITNEAFKTSSCIAMHLDTSSSTSAIFRRSPVKVMNVAPSIS
jgi:hypothetical protein